jgi:cysteine-S-conjugate beta-lyase
VGFDDLSLEGLRGRRSQKWVKYPSDVLPSWIAEMDFEIAAPIRDVLLAAIERSDFGYAGSLGVPAAFAEFAARRFGWAVAPDRVFVVPDTMVGIAEGLRLSTRPGDGVVINPPVYPPFFDEIPTAERRILEVPLLETDGGWELDFDRLEQAFADGARAYLLCNPHNPTGRVFPRPELERVAELVNRYGVFVIADEIHSPLVLPGAVHTHYVALGDETTGPSLTVTGASKAWNLAGLKCAVVVAGSEAVRDELRRRTGSLHDLTGLLGVFAAEAAFREGEPWLNELLACLDGNRRYLGELLAERLPDVGYRPPEASYLAWLDCRALPFGDEPAEAFLEQGRVALTRGLAFGREGAGFARLNFATSRGILAEIVARMAAALTVSSSTGARASRRR